MTGTCGHREGTERKMQKETANPSPEIHQYVGPYRLEKTLGKGQTGTSDLKRSLNN